MREDQSPALALWSVLYFAAVDFWSLLRFYSPQARTLNCLQPGTAAAATPAWGSNTHIYAICRISKAINWHLSGPKFALVILEPVKSFKYFQLKIVFVSNRKIWHSEHFTLVLPKHLNYREVLISGTRKENGNSDTENWNLWSWNYRPVIGITQSEQ